MEVIFKNSDRVCTLSFCGELDHHGAREALRKLEFTLDTALPKKLVLDFSGVTFMDSSGIALAVRAQRRMAALGGSAVLCGVPVQARRVFDAAGIARIIPMIEEYEV